MQNLGAAESKLLYILHWIILDAAEECADADYEKGIYHTSPFYYMFSVSSISVSTLFSIMVFDTIMIFIISNEILNNCFLREGEFLSRGRYHSPKRFCLYYNATVDCKLLLIKNNSCLLPQRTCLIDSILEFQNCIKWLL